MTDLTTNYLGMTLAHPVIPSASPLTGDLDTLHRLVEAGAPAVVLPSLFEEQIEHEAMAVHFGLEFGAESFAEAPGGYFPELDDYNTGPDQYLDLVRAAKRELNVPVIASLNGTTKGGWTLYAKILADAGADALELNIYFVAADPHMTSSEVEHQYLALVEEVRKAIDIPLAVKIGPYFSSLPCMARQLVETGADGLVLFNRFYQPDIDLETLDVVPNLILSTPADLRLPLRWTAILYGRIDCSLAASGGVHTAEEAVKMVLVGSDVTMMAAALLRHGPQHLQTVRDGMAAWFEDHEYTSIEQAKGSLSQQAVPDPAAYARSNYMRTLTSYHSEWPAR